VNVFVLLGIAVALLALLYVIYPIIRPESPASGEESASNELAARRHALYEQILELEFDQRVGKLDAADARELSEALLRQAAGLMNPNEQADAALEAQVEREIRAVRRALAAASELQPVEI
jgi:hypothetical protein